MSKRKLIGTLAATAAAFIMPAAVAQAANTSSPSAAPAQASSGASGPVSLPTGGGTGQSGTTVASASSPIPPLIAGILTWSGHDAPPRDGEPPRGGEGTDTDEDNDSDEATDADSDTSTPTEDAIRSLRASGATDGRAR